MPKLMTLSADERIAERPFTDPEHSSGDLETLRYMAHQLIDTYDDPVVCDFVPGTTGAICKSEPTGRYFRIYYIQPKLLFSRDNLTVVGFFGKQRHGADIGPLLKADKRFELEFHNHPGLLSLSTVRIPGGDFANLVLFTDPESKDRWNNTPVHRDLVARISPPYYSSIRLNNGVLPAGLAAPDALRLTKVTYIDYSTDPAWRAVRAF
jgi:hypothetical protein